MIPRFRVLSEPEVPESKARGLKSEV